MKVEQLQKMRESLVNELLEVVERHKTDIGGCLLASDVVGALEFVKLQVYLEAMGDVLLDNTSLDLS